MEKLLAVKGHPMTSEESMSLKGFDAFIEAYKAANPQAQVEVLDIYEADIPELDKDILTAWNELQAGTDFSALTAAQQDKLSRFNASTEQFLAADKVVIVNPMWNLMIPARLKAWVDTTMVAGKTFKYTAEGPVGLLDGKKVLHLQANGGVYNGQDAGAQYVKGIMEFMGAQVEHLAVEGHAQDASKAGELADEFVAKAKALGASF